MKKTIAAIAITLALAGSAFAQNSSECSKTFDPKITVCEVTIRGHTTYTELTENSTKEITAKRYKLFLEITIQSLQEETAQQEAELKVQEAEMPPSHVCIQNVLALHLSTPETVKATVACFEADKVKKASPTPEEICQKFGVFSVSSNRYATNAKVFHFQAQWDGYTCKAILIPDAQ